MRANNRPSHYNIKNHTTRTHVPCWYVKQEQIEKVIRLACFDNISPSRKLEQIIAQSERKKANEAKKTRYRIPRLFGRIASSPQA
jgi:hypothetical protein